MEKDEFSTSGNYLVGISQLFPLHEINTYFGSDRSAAG